MTFSFIINALVNSFTYLRHGTKKKSHTLQSIARSFLFVIYKFELLQVSSRLGPYMYTFVVRAHDYQICVACMSVRDADTKKLTQLSFKSMLLQ